MLDANGDTHGSEISDEIGIGERVIPRTRRNSNLSTSALRPSTISGLRGDVQQREETYQ